MSDSGVPLVKIKNVTPPVVDIQDVQRVPHSVITGNGRIKRYALEKGDILIAMTGATVGKVGRMPDTSETFYLNQRVGKVFLDKPDKADYDFIYYVLSQETHVREMFGIAHGSAQANISGSQIESLEIPLPPITEQRRIAAILGTLDDKIELNRRMNRTLERIAAAIFKSWFIDFLPVRAKQRARTQTGDPVRAKADLPAAQGTAQAGGRDPLAAVSGTAQAGGLPPEIADLFPDSFQDSPLGPIPKGWTPGTIKDCCEKVQNGGTPKRSEPSYWTPATIPWLTSGEVRQTIVIRTGNAISELGFENSSTKWFPSGSTAVALYGATAGQVCLIAEPMTTNQAVCGLIPKPNHRYFNYFVLTSSESSLAHQASGSAQQNISKGLVERTTVVIPPLSILKEFEKLTASLFDKWILNLRCNDSLSRTRDTLLPKLLSGEIELPVAEAVAEEVGA
jgi:type I restriction enzyme S subunit